MKRDPPCRTRLETLENQRGKAVSPICTVLFLEGGEFCSLPSAGKRRSQLEHYKAHHLAHQTVAGASRTRAWFTIAMASHNGGGDLLRSPPAGITITTPTSGESLREILVGAINKRHGPSVTFND